MTVQDLINELQGFSPDAEVRLATQPSWPFEYSVSAVAQTEPGEGYGIRQNEDGWYVTYDADDADFSDGPLESAGEAREALESRLAREGTDPVVYIGEGTQLGYLPGAGRRALGWS